MKKDMTLKKDNISEIYLAKLEKKVKLSEYTSGISAGFPSPADDYIDRELDLNEYLIDHPASTFFVRVIGDSMINAGMKSGDLIIVDRALEATHNKIVLAIIEGEFTVKRYVKRGKKIFLVPENENYDEIEIKENMDFQVWGVVTTVIHKMK